MVGVQLFWVEGNFVGSPALPRLLQLITYNTPQLPGEVSAQTLYWGHPVLWSGPLLWGTRMAAGPRHWLRHGSECSLLALQTSPHLLLGQPGATFRV